jgi:hypothetical protein
VALEPARWYRVLLTLEPSALNGTEDREQPEFWLGFDATGGVRGGQ